MHIIKSFIKNFRSVYGHEYVKTKIIEVNETMIIFPKVENCWMRYVHKKKKGSIVYPDKDRTEDFQRFLQDHNFTVGEQYTRKILNSWSYVMEFSKTK